MTINEKWASHTRYRKYPFAQFPNFIRAWPEKWVDEPPTWCSVDLRDGNQALVDPMTVSRKLTLFKLLVNIGFKEIEVGFPAASTPDYEFVRTLVEENLIPEDVTIQVLTQAREELIEETFSSLKGYVGRVIVHIYNSTSELQRRVVFKQGKGAVKDIAIHGVMLCKKYAEENPDLDVVLEYSPESFTGTEPEYALDVCNTIIHTWNPRQHPQVSLETPVGHGDGFKPNMIINLPATVEMSTPNVYADYVQWVGERLNRREDVILSVHPHNDRGTGVAAAELAVLAGADRVEGCLFGNGERTGNVCLVTLALNLFSQGINPHLDFSNIDEVKKVVQYCTQLPVHPRHPYGGDLVYTAFSGSHQDAINKGLSALRDEADKAGLEVSQMPWEVPYLPIDPADVGRTYEAIIRVNSQSGKGGVAYLMETEHHLTLPRRLQVEFSKEVQRYTETSGGEIAAEHMWTLFLQKYNPYCVPSEHEEMYTLLTYSIDNRGTPNKVGGATSAVLNVSLSTPHGVQHLTGVGNGPVDAFCDALKALNITVDVLDYHEHAKSGGGEAEAVCYVECHINNESAVWGVAIHPSIVTASLNSITNALNSALLN